MSRFDAILNILKKSGKDVGAEIGAGGDDLLKYLKSGDGLLADVKSLPGRAKSAASDAVSGLGGTPADYKYAAKNLFSDTSAATMSPETAKKIKLLRALGLVGAGGAAAGGYAMMDDED